MKKAISTVLVAAMLMAGAGSAFAAPTDVSNKCMHLNEIIENGYWTNGKKPVCGCDSCQVVLADYDHLDRVFDKSNARMFSKDMTEVLETYYEDEDWQRGDYLLMSCDRKNGTIYAAFNKKDQSFNFENLDSEQKDKYKEALERFIDTIKSIQEGNTSNEKAAQIIEGIKEMQEICPNIENNANKYKLAIIVLGGAASLASLVMGMKQVAKNPVPNYVENPNAKMTLKDVLYTSKLGLKTLAVTISSGLIMVGSFLLGDFAKNKIMNHYQCPALERTRKNYFNYN